tara:strand:- start:12386 stop:14605 length:2220 start_codon:yes stop_codon:yes gene_type:complete
MTSSSIPIIGYTDKLSARPGETIAFKVSCSSPQKYYANLVRVISCDPNPKGPGIQEEKLESNFDGVYQGKPQNICLGSAIRVTETNSLDTLKSFTLIATIWPTRPQAGLQGIITRREVKGNSGFGLAINTKGACAILGGLEISVGMPLIERRWYRIWMSYNSSTGTVTVGQKPLSKQIDAEDEGFCEAVTKVKNNFIGSGDLLIAAFRGEPRSAHYNGKIESPIILETAINEKKMSLMTLNELQKKAFAYWDFSQEISSPNIIDSGPHGLDGYIENLPTRAMTSSEWDNSSHDWTKKTQHYSAIHFHEDDIYDCGWNTDFVFTVPDEFKSGIYAARLETDSGEKEMVPFFVPAKKNKPQSRICILIPTFTYIVYGNISRGNSTYKDDGSLAKKIKDWGAWPYNCDEHKEFGLSTYNDHTDGSGICTASFLRPIITMRTATVSYPDVPGSGLRHFAADAHLWFWLEKMGYDFDIITDHELHHEGINSIKNYDIVMTPSHPEYHTTETLDALQAYIEEGGHFMYLGGNGFYWKVALNKNFPGAVEIRRAEGGIRLWASEPGEYYNAFDGTYGGMWRRNGRPPQNLCGIGFTAQGKHFGDPYRRTAASRDPLYAWIFEGIKDDIIGNFGLSGGGAAGFELDRADVKLGTPLNAVVLATSEGHGKHFGLVPEEILMTNMLAWNGEPYDDLIRADIVYFDTPKGGAVFAVGSITYCGSLPYNNCKNNISQLTKNVINRFLKEKN